MKKELMEFKKFVSNYNFKDLGIRFKYDHSIRVTKIGNLLSKKLKLDNKETYMITIACLLHDLARFDQVKIYNTFNDKKSFDHGDYAYDLINNTNYLRNYTEDDTFDSAILKAIKYHNKYIIGPCNEKELLFSKIVRDADKIDILLNGGARMFNDYEVNEYEISDAVYDGMMNEKCLSYDVTNNKVDRLLLTLGFLYDFNFKCSFQFIKGKRLVKNMIDFIKSKNKNKDTLEKLNNIEDKLEKYIERMVSNG